LTTEFRLITPKPILSSPQLAYLSIAGLVVSPTEIIPRQPHLISLTFILLSYLSFIIQPPLFWCYLSTSSLFAVSFVFLNFLLNSTRSLLVYPDISPSPYSFDLVLLPITLCYCTVLLTRQNIAFSNFCNQLGPLAIYIAV
jgi:hypothetical protein